MATKFDVLCAAKATEKEFARRVEELEAECKAEFMDRYRADGTDRMRSTVFDPKAAWMTMKGGKPAGVGHRFQVNDIAELDDWMDRERPETDGFATDNVAQFAEWWFNRTGECPDGCSFITFETEPVEPTPALTVKEKMVLPVLQDNPRILGEVNQLLLGDGDVQG